jgi:hypothetical protein
LNQSGLPVLSVANKLATGSFQSSAKIELGITKNSKKRFRDNGT